MWRFVIFFLLAFGVVFGSHYLVYSSWLRLFPILSNHKRLIFWFFVFASSSFIISSWLSHYVDNELTRIYYYATFIWLSFFVYFFFASIFLLVIQALLRNMPVTSIAAAVFLLSAVLSTVGIYSAFGLQVRREKVEIENIPNAWRGRKIVQISDVHLGQIHGVKRLRQIQSELDLIKPDIIFITGDLFDGMDGHLDLFVGDLQKIQAPLGVYFVSGNHEFYLGLEETEKVLAKTGIVWLKEKVVELDGVQIIGRNFRSNNGVNDLTQELQSMPDFDAQKINILLYHVPEKITEAERAGIDLMLSGHTHKGQIYPFGWITKAIFKGFDYGLLRYKSLSVNISSGAGTWGPPMRTSGQNEIVEIELK